MIYDIPNPEDPIKQGDIFYPLPKSNLELDKILVLPTSESNNFEEVKWDELSDKPENQILVAVEPIWAIVASQNCDNARLPLITLFVIRTFAESLPSSIPATPKAWQEWITKRSRDNLKWFYLPQQPGLFAEKMLVLLEEVIQIPRSNLESRKATYRKGRLNQVATEHFRENIAQFFRRYPYDEWYSLNKEEFGVYKDKNGDVPPFLGQE